MQLFVRQLIKQEQLSRSVAASQIHEMSYSFNEQMRYLHIQFHTPSRDSKVEYRSHLLYNNRSLYAVSQHCAKFYAKTIF